MESDLYNHLIPINDTDEIPKDVYRIRNLTGSHFYIKRSEYNTFCDLWIPHTQKIYLSMQLYSTPHHALYFNIDSKGENCKYNELLRKFESNLKLHFFPAIHDFTIIYAMKSSGKGVHVHLPEFTIGHDDYLEMCKRLQSSSLNGSIYLNTSIDWSFPGIGKPETEENFYKPRIIKYFTENETLSFKLDQLNPRSKTELDSKFKRLLKNNDSFFRKLLSLESNEWEDYIFHLMMPVINRFTPRYKISYITNIIDNPNGNSDTFEHVAKISFQFEDRMSYVLKSKTLSFKTPKFLWFYNYLRYKAVAIKSIDTDNTAIKSWFEMFSVPLNNNNEEQSIFGKINLALRLDNPAFLEDLNPLQTVLKYDNGYFFLPVFFTLVKHLGVKAPDLVFNLRPLFDSSEIQSLLTRLENLNQEYVDSISGKLTLNTLFFCAHNMNVSPAKNVDSFQDTLIEIVEKSKHLILGVCSSSKMSDLLLKIQERYFPIKVIVQTSNTNIKSSVVIWNACRYAWKDVTDKERHDHLSNLWTTVKTYLHEYRISGGTGGPDDETVKGLNLSSVVSRLSSNKSMEQEKIEMDAHKWFLRLNNGYMIDLLTGHVGAVVPEFYLSNRTTNIDDIPRPKLVEYLNESPTALMQKLYSLFVDQKFFTHFLKQLLLDVTDDIYDTASDIVSKELLSIDWQHDKNVKSMLMFYIHLCKLVSFDYNVLMYMLDILASTMIAANYDRKFFVCKGPTNNGKSMLFEIIGTMFGQYFSSILSDNLQKSKSSASTAPSPDLALTLFTCRVIAMEELESNFSENRIKQLTGNSRVAFRSLFDTSKSAVPTAKVFATTNNAPDCLVTQAFRERVVVLPFNSTFQDDAPTKTSERIMKCLYPKEKYVVENAFKGCFFLLYFHLRNCVRQEDGLVHYRKQPKIVKIYTQNYLKNTDVYTKFKCHMDVQIVQNTMTTMTDLHSAIREFMKDKKANADCETEIKIKFEREFSEYRRTEKTMGLSSYTDIFSTHDEPLTCTNKSLLNDSSDESEDETILAANSFKRKSSNFENDLTPRKKQKTEETDEDKNVSVFYEHVCIKKYKKTFTQME